MNPHLLPLILLGTVVGAIRRGEDGFAIGIIAMIAVLMLIQWGFAEYDAAQKRKRDEQRRRSDY